MFKRFKRSKPSMLADKISADKYSEILQAKQSPKLVAKIQAAESATQIRDWTKAVTSWEAVLKDCAPLTINNEELVRHARLYISIIKRLSDPSAYQQRIKEHGGFKGPDSRNTVVYTCYTKAYDSLLPPDFIDGDFDYVVFTDDDTNGFGLYEVRPLTHPKLDGTRGTRYPKMHPHILFPEYETAIWLDASLMLTGDLQPIIEKFKASGKVFGNSDHPARATVDEEFADVVERGKDTAEAILPQKAYYQSVGFQTNDLSENTFLLFNLSNQAYRDRLKKAMDIWWEMINRFSKRDQLSLAFALHQAGESRFRAIRRPQQARNHPAFIYVPHKIHYPLLDELEKAING